MLLHCLNSFCTFDFLPCCCLWSPHPPPFRVMYEQPALTSPQAQRHSSSVLPGLLFLVLSFNLSPLVSSLFFINPLFLFHHLFFCGVSSVLLFFHILSFFSLFCNMHFPLCFPPLPSALSSLYSSSLLSKAACSEPVFLFVPLIDINMETWCVRGNQNPSQCFCEIQAHPHSIVLVKINSISG